LKIRIIMAVIMAVICLFAIPSMGNTSEIPQLELKQALCIKMAHFEGSKIELYGDTWGQTAAAIAYQESACDSSKYQTNGVVVGDLDNKGKPKSLGIMQVQVPTARHVNSIFPHLFKDKYGDRDPTDEELTIDLLIDNSFNIKIGVHYYAWLLEYRQGDWAFAVLSYNRGTGYNLTDINNYVRLVKKWRKEKVLPFLRGKYKIIGRKK